MHISEILLYLLASAYFTFTILFSMVSYINQTNTIVYHYIPETLGRYFQAIQALPLIFSSEAFVSVFSSSMGRYMQVLIALAEALAVHFFVHLLLHRLGGITNLQNQFVNERIARALPVCVRFGTIQFVVLKPLFEIVALILPHMGIAKEDWWFTFRVLVAMTSFGGFGTLFFIYFRIHHIIEEFRPGHKFLALKLTVFTPIFQTFVFDIIQHLEIMKPGDAVVMDNALLLVWMLPISIFLFHCFVLRDLIEDYHHSNDKESKWGAGPVDEQEPLMKSWVMM